MSLRSFDWRVSAFQQGLDIHITICYSFYIYHCYVFMTFWKDRMQRIQLSWQSTTLLCWRHWFKSGYSFQASGGVVYAAIIFYEPCLAFRHIQQFQNFKENGKCRNRFTRVRFPSCLFRTVSSVGQSSRLITDRSGVRVPYSPLPKTLNSKESNYTVRR